MRKKEGEKEKEKEEKKKKKKKKKKEEEGQKEEKENDPPISIPLPSYFPLFSPFEFFFFATFQIEPPSCDEKPALELVSADAFLRLCAWWFVFSWGKMAKIMFPMTPLSPQRLRGCDRQSQRSW